MLKPSNGNGLGRAAWARCGALVLAVCALAGCDDYLDRRDTITYGVGDAVEVNKATQTIQRWPRAARYDRWHSDGERARIAVDRYRKREIKDTSATSTDSVTTSSGP